MSSSYFCSFSHGDGDGYGDGDGDDNGVGLSECVVFLKNFNGQDDIFSFPYDHVLHKSCVDKWLLEMRL
jgi:hypothetical protein